MTHDELLKRLREATGADRELDFDITEALAPPEHADHWKGQRVRVYHGIPVAEYAEDSPHHRPKGSKDENPAEHYTASLDAAVALVEKMLPHCSWNVESEQYYDKGTIRPRFIARIRAQVSPRLHVVASFATPALALLIALLEALSAKGEPKP